MESKQSYKPSQSFQSAAAYLSASSFSVPTATKLELYGLFKHVTSSPTPSTSRPSIFDMTGRPKWDAWQEAGKIWGEGRQPEAEERYMVIARRLGWIEGNSDDHQVGQEQAGGEAGGEDIWDQEEASSSHKQRSGGGMGNCVSVIPASPLEAKEQDTLHGLAVSNNLTGLMTYLQDHARAAVNALDEFGYTPLHLASDRGHVEIVRLLLLHGADRDLKDPDDLTALELAHIAGHTEIEKMLEKSS